MGKAVSLLAVCLLVASAFPGLAPGRAQAQTAALPCSVTAPSPMQGQYSGPWHSDGDYHFSAFGTDIDLKITIDGTLSLTIAADGRVSGTATGSVDAPIYDYGRKDVSSGYGTISGPVSGTITGAGAVLVLSAPVISMHWGTFVGGGYTVDQNITMPDYTLTVGSGDCISSSGSIAETNFPPKWLVADGSMLAPVLAPGIGTATGTWSVTSSDAATYTQLSQQVDSFIASASAALAGDPLSYGAARSQILEPLRTLIASIQAHPTVARCLLERLGAWEVATAASLYGRAGTAVGSLSPDSLDGLLGVRHASDPIRIAGELGSPCHVADDGVAGRLRTALSAALGGEAGNVPYMAWLARELLLWGGDPVRASVQAAIDASIHGPMGPSASASTLLDSAREAYLFGDDADTAAAYSRLTTQPRAVVTHARTATPTPAGPKHKKKKKPAPKPWPTVTPKPRPTATAIPKTLDQILTAGIASVSGTASGGQTPTFSWNAVPGAGGTPTQYVVTVTRPGSPAIVWSWAGTGTSVTYSDTSLPSVPDTSEDGWSIPLPDGYRWSVLAVSGSRIVGLKLR